MVLKSCLSRVCATLICLSLILGIGGCGGKVKKLQLEVEHLKQEVEITKKENENLHKQVELLSQTVQHLSELNAIMQQANQKPGETGEEGADQSKKDAKKK